MPATQTSSSKTALNAFRTTPAEQKQLHALAREQGLTLTELVRQGLQLKGFKPEES
jgi:hypothetical protein